jgi:hypothetical protein
MYDGELGIRTGIAKAGYKIAKLANYFLLSR